jgi:hypothetical protein
MLAVPNTLDVPNILAVPNIWIPRFHGQVPDYQEPRIHKPMLMKEQS